MTRFGRAFARARFLSVLSLLLPSFGIGSAAAQSIVSGSLRGQIVSTDSSPVISALVTMTDQSAGTGYSFLADRRGRFSLALVVPGTYDILAEQAGYQPVRQHGIVVSPGEETLVSFVLARRPPPITQVEEVAEPPRANLSNGRWIGEELSGRRLQQLDFRQDVTDVSRDLSRDIDPLDGRPGFALAAGGLPQSYSRLFVDGIEQSFLRHPGSVAEPASTPVFPRNSIMGVMALDDAFDTEWNGPSGTLLSATGRSGSRRTMLLPYLTFSGAKLGGKSLDNPGDSSATSIQGGLILTGSLVKDTAQYALGFNYETLETPSANPWERDSTSFGGIPTSLRDTISIIAADSFGTSVDQFTHPVVRTFKGGNGFGRVDWHVSGSLGVFARVNFAQWKEQSPQLGVDLLSGAGSTLDARDLSGAVGLTYAGSRTADEFRLGVRLSKRDWTSGSAPATYLVGEGAAIGFAPLLPALFDQHGVDVSNAFQYVLGRHRIKAGIGLSFGKWKENYTFARNGRFRFGDVDQFGNAQGDFLQMVGPGTTEFSTTDLGLFLQDVWTVSNSFRFEGGIRGDRQQLPKGEISLNQSWVSTSGIPYDVTPDGDWLLSPRVGFTWDNREGWVVKGGGGLFAGRTDLALFSEAALYDGPVVARLGQGTFSGWPAVPDSVAAPVVGPRLTLFDDEYRPPRTAKWDLSISHAFPGRIVVEIAGGYHHTDFIPRRQDLNLIASATGQTQEGRPIYGTLVKQGGMVSALPGSNRRFSGFDMVSGILSNGFSDYYAVTATVERRSANGLGLRASYTYSRTDDNWLLGSSGDPADQLSPFPEDPVANEWVDGRSDLDIPHRLAFSADYRFPGKSGLEATVRYRFRSGLPFTPGFRPGVDLNGDGSGGNDPAFIDSSIPGTDQLVSDHGCLADQVGQFAARNSCREKAAHALDLRLAYRLPVMVMGGNLLVTVDAYNVVSTEIGMVDRAVYLVDPTQPLTTSPGGAVVVPLIANPQFGSLLSRRGEPRLVRFGLTVDY